MSTLLGEVEKILSNHRELMQLFHKCFSIVGHVLLVQCLILVPLDDVLSVRFWYRSSSWWTWCDYPNSVHFSSSFLSSSCVIALLVDHLLMKSSSHFLSAKVFQCKFDWWVFHHSDLSTQADTLHHQLSPHLCHVFGAVFEKGMLCWLTTLPILGKLSFTKLYV